LAKSGLTRTLNQYNNETNPEVMDIRRSWNVVQHDLQCCGVQNYTDWLNAATVPFNETVVPSSCCIDGIVMGCAKDITSATTPQQAEKIIFTQGCLHKAVDNIAISHIGAVGIGLSSVELLGVICACLLARSIRFSYETV